jgi:vacuolar-type H+-ATPase subunit I/STV1
MTSDELERGIEFLVKHQAMLETQVERTSRQVEEFTKETAKRLNETNQRLEETNVRLEDTNQRLEIYADMQREFIQVVTRHIEAQGEINSSLRGTIHELKESQVRTDGALRAMAVSQTRTDARLDRLAETVERFITEGRNGKP